jgi:hypothetical protein
VASGGAGAPEVVYVREKEGGASKKWGGPELGGPAPAVAQREFARGERFGGERRRRDLRGRAPEVARMRLKKKRRNHRPLL